MPIPESFRYIFKDIECCFMCKHFTKEMEHGGCSKHKYGLATLEELFGICDDFKRDT